MSTWEAFEIECTDYLNDTFHDYADFTHHGGSDSTVPDIHVTTKSGVSFYIDAKHSPAQCGQFVLLPDIATNTFRYSSQNVNRINAYASKIMDYMNHHFDAFREAGTSGKDILMSGKENVFSNWIIQAYKDKGVRFFITNNHTILPIERFQQYFEVSAKYRIKRSGSNSVGKSHIPMVRDYINNMDYVIRNSRTDNDKFFVISPENLHNQRFILRGYEYMFSLRDSEYELRKLSNTYNANVIFSITQKSQMGLSKDEFIKMINEL